MTRLAMTYDLAHAAAWDAGNRSMKAGKRTRWSLEDRDACWREFDRLWPWPEECTDEHHVRDNPAGV